jgi:hypothetical protein
MFEFIIIVFLILLFFPLRRFLLSSRKWLLTIPAILLSITGGLMGFLLGSTPSGFKPNTLILVVMGAVIFLSVGLKPLMFWLKDFLDHKDDHGNNQQRTT